MKIFYAVTDGDYSDYHIIAITDNKERADNIAKIYRDDGWNAEPKIEEFVDSGVNVVGFSIGVLIGRGFSNKDPIGITVSIMAGIAFIAFIVMCE